MRAKLREGFKDSYVRNCPHLLIARAEMSRDEHESLLDSQVSNSEAKAVCFAILGFPALQVLLVPRAHF